MNLTGDFRNPLGCSPRCQRAALPRSIASPIHRSDGSHPFTEARDGGLEPARAPCSGWRSWPASLGLALRQGWLSAGPRSERRSCSLYRDCCWSRASALGCWQHRALVEPLREIGLAGARGAAVPNRRRPVARARPADRPAHRRKPAARRRRCARRRGPRSRPLRARGGRRRSPARHQRPTRLGFGDEVLRQIARRLTVLCPSGRRWWPESAATGSRCWRRRRRSGTVAADLPATLIEGLGRSFCIAGCELTLCVHGGAALFPEHGASLQHLMRVGRAGAGDGAPERGPALEPCSTPT